jgi:hypothetical protein
VRLSACHVMLHPYISGCCRYDKIAKTCGHGAPSRKLLKQLMNNDFDPEEWDKHTIAAFDDSYYAEQEPEAAVRADDEEVAREMAAWGDMPGDVQRDPALQTFADVHARVTGFAPGELAETDYVGEGAAAADQVNLRRRRTDLEGTDRLSEHLDGSDGGTHSDTPQSDGSHQADGGRGHVEGAELDSSYNGSLATQQEAKSKVRCKSD